MIHIKIFYFIFSLFVIFGLIDIVKGLQCRIEESAANNDMKKVIRKCMQKIGSNNQNNFNNYNNNNNYHNNRDFNGEFMISSSSNSDEQDNSNRLKNREHLQMRTNNNRNKRFSNNESKIQEKYHHQQQQNDRRNGNGNGNGNNQRNNNYNGYQRNRNSNNNDTEMIDRQYENDRNCIVHCFFEEMNMLNNDDYPDKYKVLHILTRDVHEYDLREFYTDSIQECFHFLDMEQRKDKCTFSKTLINCMTDYARANCEDWQDHTIVFN